MRIETKNMLVLTWLIILRTADLISRKIKKLT